MSYSILYSRLYIALPDGTYIALVKGGDNNVWSWNPLTGREQRSRSWESYSFGTGRMSVTRQEIASWLDRQHSRVLKEAEATLNEHPDWCRYCTAAEEASKRFGYYAGVSIQGHHCSTTTWGAFRSFYEKGLEHAVSPETFRRLCGHLEICWYEGDFKTTGPIRSLEELRQKWDELSARFGNYIWIRPYSGYSADRLADIIHSSSRKGIAVKAGFRDADGKYDEAFIKTLIPLTFTRDKAGAMKISRTLMKKRSGFDLFRTLAPGYSFERFDYF